MKSSLAGLISGVLGSGLLLAAAAGLGIWVLNELDKHPLQALGIDVRQLNDEQARAWIDKLAAAYLEDEQNVGLVVGVIRGGQPEVYGYGHISRERRDRPDGQTVFEIASVGKTFTATLLADMHLQQEVDWSDPLLDYLPEGINVPQQNGRQITLFDLATHTAGLPSLPPNFYVVDQLNPYKHFTVADMYYGLTLTEISGTLGQSYAYSNFGYGLLGHALERRAGMRYEQLVQSRICQPLGLESTKITIDDSMRERLAIGHDGGVAVPIWEDLTMAGAGSLLSTADDLLAYLAAHCDTKLAGPLGPALQETTRKRRPTDSSQTSIGLGWHIDSEHALDIVWHNGGSGGSSSYIGYVAGSQDAVVVLSNSTNSVDELGKQILYLLHYTTGGTETAPASDVANQPDSPDDRLP